MADEQDALLAEVLAATMERQAAEADLLQNRNRGIASGYRVLADYAAEAATRHRHQVGHMGVYARARMEIEEREQVREREVHQAVVRTARPVIREKLTDLGAATMAVHRERERVAAELDQAADRWLAKAAAQKAPTSELKRYLTEKAQSARDNAAALRRGEDVK